MNNIKYFLLVAVVLLAAWLLYLSNDEPQLAQVPPQSGVTFMDILNADDLKQGVLAAVENSDEQGLQQWQQKAVEVGLAANLDASDMAFLAGERGLDFMRFRAKRTLFYRQFEHYYYALKDITPLKQAYPEAVGLFAKADEMIAQRDKAISQIAKELAGEKHDYRAFVAQARQQWLQKSNNDNPPQW